MKLKFFLNLIKEIIKIRFNMREIAFKVQKIDDNFVVLGNAYAYIYLIKVNNLNKIVGIKPLIASRNKTIKK